MTIFTNALQIPSLFEPLFTTIHRISFLLVLPVLAAAIAHENISQIEDRANYTGLFVRVVVILSLLIIYDRFFTAITYGADLLGEAVMPDEEFKTVLDSIFTQIRNNEDFGVFNLFKSALITGITYLTYFFTFVAYTILIWLRFMLLSLLYLAGPVLIVFGIYHKTSGGLAAWLRSLFQVSAWVVTLSLLVRIASFMNLTSIYHIENVNTISIATANVLFVLLFVFTPAITAALLSGGSIGSIGSNMIGIGTSATYALVRKVASRKAALNLRNREPEQNPSQNEELV